MQETYFVTVKTEDGKSLVDAKIIGDLFSLSFALSRLSHALLHQGEDIVRLEMLRGGGTGPSAQSSSQPTESSQSDA